MRQAPSPHRIVRGVVLLLAAIFCLGVAHIAVLPPWEGFDEIAHFSSIQELADTGVVPRYGVDSLSADVVGYAGPLPYTVPWRRTSYRALHDARTTVIAGGPTRFSPSKVANWQAQHPPLYYAALAPLYRAVHGLDWKGCLLVLRLASWLMAIAGLGLGAWGTLRASLQGGHDDRAFLGPYAAPLSLVWPLAFAEFFPDMARLGNDSLCLLLFGGAWLLTLELVRQPDEGTEPKGRPLLAAILGFLLGLGLWTKAFFLPLTFGAAVILAARAWRSRSPSQALDVALVLGLSACIGGAWYVAAFLSTGAVSGSDEGARLAKAGGLLHGLVTNASPLRLVRGAMGTAATIGWAGTWSLARLPEVWMIGSLLLLASAFGAYLLRLREAPLSAWAALAFVAPLLATLGYHVLVRLALSREGDSTAGWYVNIAAPAFGLVLALGWRWPRLQGLLALWAGAFAAVSMVWQLSLFSGCAAPDAASHYTLAGATCFWDGARLSLLGFPVLGCVAAVAAAAAGAAAALHLLPGRTEDRTALAPLEPLG